MRAVHGHLSRAAAFLTLLVMSCGRRASPVGDDYDAALRSHVRGRPAATTSVGSKRVYVGDPLHVVRGDAYGRVIGFDLGAKDARRSFKLVGLDERRMFGADVDTLELDASRTLLAVGAPAGAREATTGRAFVFELDGTIATPIAELRWSADARATGRPDEFGAELALLPSSSIDGPRVVVAAPCVASSGGVALFDAGSGARLATRTNQRASDGYGCELLRVNDRNKDGVDDVAVSLGKGRDGGEYGFEVLSGADLAVLESHIARSRPLWSEWMLRAELDAKLGGDWQLHSARSSSDTEIQLVRGAAAPAPNRAHDVARVTWSFGAAAAFCAPFGSDLSRGASQIAYAFADPGYFRVGALAKFGTPLGAGLESTVPAEVRVPIVHRVPRLDGSDIESRLADYANTGLGMNGILVGDIDGLGSPDLLLTTPKGCEWKVVLFSLDRDRVLHECVP